MVLSFDRFGGCQAIYDAGSVTTAGPAAWPGTRSQNRAYEARRPESACCCGPDTGRYAACAMLAPTFAAHRSILCSTRPGGARREWRTAAEAFPEEPVHSAETTSTERLLRHPTMRALAPTGIVSCDHAISAGSPSTAISPAPVGTPVGATT